MLAKLRFSFAMLICFACHTTNAQRKQNTKDSSQHVYAVVRTCALTYPKKAQEMHIEGEVVVRFDMDSNCNFVNFRIVKSLGYGCDEEAIKSLNCRLVYHTGETGHCKALFNLEQSVRFVLSKEEE